VLPLLNVEEEEEEEDCIQDGSFADEEVVGEREEEVFVC